MQHKQLVARVPSESSTVTTSTESLNRNPDAVNSPTLSDALAGPALGQAQAVSARPCRQNARG